MINYHQSEWIEREALTALFDSASNEIHQSLGLKLERIYGALCFAATAEPSILINRCFGLSHDKVETPKTINAIKAFYKDAGISEFFLHLIPDTNLDTIHKMLIAAGMKKNRAWMKFTRDITPSSLIESDLQIKRIGPDQAIDFAQIAVPCFDMLELSIPLVASLANHTNSHIYVGYKNNIPVATGSLFIKDGIAYYDWAATHNDFRKRGYQGAVLRQMICDAIDLGYQIFYTATGEAVRGDAQHSYKNILLAGFKEDYLRENWSPS